MIEVTKINYFLFFATKMSLLLPIRPIQVVLTFLSFVHCITVYTYIYTIVE